MDSISRIKKERAVKRAIFWLLLLGFGARPVLAQKAPEGIWQGYDGEWRHVSNQLIALAQATPEEKFSWRPGPGARWTSGGYMHIVKSIFDVISVTGSIMPADLNKV